MRFATDGWFWVKWWSSNGKTVDRWQCNWWRDGASEWALKKLEELGFTF